MTATVGNERSGDGSLLSDADVVARFLNHIDAGSTDVGERSWREPTEHYVSRERFAREVDFIATGTTMLCPSAALAEHGSYLARDAAGVPLVGVRGKDGRARVFRNACRHRGVRVAEGHGCQHAFVCGYHGWTYGTNGELRHVPHESGFPDLDRTTRGLVEVPSVEAGGLVFARLGEGGSPPEAPVAFVPDEHELLGYTETDIPANWKLFVESFLEGYHIRSTHRTTFYPLQYDNLNVIEFFGEHSRVAYPYRSIEKLRERSLRPGSIDFYLTYVYHLFPNVIVATTPGRVNVIVLEPQSVDSTRMVSFWTGVPDSEPTRSSTGEERGPDYQAAQAEDIAMVTSAQRGLAAGANEFLEFGLYESAIVRFYERLERALAAHPG